MVWREGAAQLTHRGKSHGPYGPGGAQAWSRVRPGGAPAGTGQGWPLATQKGGGSGLVGGDFIGGDDVRLGGGGDGDKGGGGVGGRGS